MNPAYPAVANRAAHRCEYCRAPEAAFNFPFEVEHILPPMRGGSSSLDNLALACRACNLFKRDAVAARESKSGQHVRLFDPRNDSWKDHFHVNALGEVGGLTEVGKVSVEFLRFNTASQLAARPLWIKFGLFP